MFRVYCIELAKENRDKADAIMNKYYIKDDIDVKNLEHSYRKGLATVQYWFTCKCSEDIEVIANELKANGIELF